MSDDIARKRDHVLSLYSGPRWRAKVSKMSDSQVVAIYLHETNKAAQQPSEPEKEKEDGTDDIPF